MKSFSPRPSVTRCLDYFSIIGFLQQLNFPKSNETFQFGLFRSQQVSKWYRPCWREGKRPLDHSCKSQTIKSLPRPKLKRTSWTPSDVTKPKNWTRFYETLRLIVLNIYLRTYLGLGFEQVFLLWSDQFYATFSEEIQISSSTETTKSYHIRYHK